MPKFLDDIKTMLTGLLPLSKKTAYNRRNDPPALAHMLDVDKLHTILRTAEAGDPTDLFSIYRDIVGSDTHIQSELNKRKIAVLGDTLSIQAARPKHPDDEAARQTVDALVMDCHNWTRALGHLMDATLWPVAVVEKVYRPSRTPGLRYELKGLYPVPDQLLDWRSGDLHILDTDPETGRALTTSHPADPRRYIIHRGHLLSAPDWWGGPMRAVLFWWLFSVLGRDWWARFLDRYGAPFMVGKYDPADDDSRMSLERAFSAAQRLFGVVVSNSTQVEIKQAASSDSGNAYASFLQVAQREKSKLIVGQTLSAEAEATGLGGGVAAAHEQVRADIRQFDALLLGQTLRDQLFRQYLAINGLSGNAPRAAWGGESDAERKTLADLLSSLSQAGLQVATADLPKLSERIGVTIERSQPTLATSPSLLPLASRPTLLRADDAQTANDQIARNTAADLAQAFRGRYAPLRDIVLSSKSAQECEDKVRSFLHGIAPGKAEEVVTAALIAYAGNGSEQ